MCVSQRFPTKLTFFFLLLCFNIQHTIADKISSEIFIEIEKVGNEAATIIEGKKCIFYKVTPGMCFFLIC